ncbi:winged helix-turn-helix transcriptional regulator [Arthrobacter sp. MSA 4-2]|uniref:ArsR/SmtB family transcription factor n=1 Tax=Arthrobacter sp. MSA 4-2 TaxID=2794349 RepID=UPI0018E88A03|nr:metalloregulator ArsR/SmtB family transcription factor [Arthrobacter sp. MSA 4-2]MBJ2122458.1 winged helix-turn-helix transcriptional regulator [Arthrobacter sp. MSA 4-2]
MNPQPALAPAPGDAACNPAGPPALDAAQAKEQAVVFKALADPNRLRLLSIIKTAPTGTVCVCDLTDPLNLTQPTVSHHLKVLLDAGLLQREKRGIWAYFSLTPGALDHIAGSLARL